MAVVLITASIVHRPQAQALSANQGGSINNFTSSLNPDSSLTLARQAPLRHDGPCMALSVEFGKHLLQGLLAVSMCQAKQHDDPSCLRKLTRWSFNPDIH